jgi:autotransporter translocation and assembly factor TamB
VVAPVADFHPRGQPTGREQANVRIEAQELDASTIATYVLDDSTGLTASLSADLQLPASQLLGGLQWRDLVGHLDLQELVLDRDRVRLRLGAPSRALLHYGEARLEDLVLPIEMYRRDTDEFEAAGRIKIDGRLTGDGGGLRVRIDDLALLAAARAIPGRLSLPDGILSLQANLTGSLDQPALDASANIELELLGQLSARVFGRRRAWNGSATWVTPVEDSLQVTASAPAVNIWPKWDELTMRARSAGIDLLPLLDQVPQLGALTGTMRLDVTADSLATNPHLVGQVEVEDLRLALLDVKPGYHFPTGRIQFSERPSGGTHAELRDFSGTTTRGGGQLQLTGFLDLLPVGGTDYRIQLTGKDVAYQYEDVFDAARIDLQLTLRRTAEGSLVAGNVRLAQPESEVQLVDLIAPPVPPPPTVQNRFLENTRLDLYVDVDRLRTRSELSDITLDGQARIYGTFYQPRFQGELEVPEGHVIILNRQFIFNRGRIVLDRLVPTYSILDLLYDPILLDPELDLEATTVVQPRDINEPEIEVTMSLVGPARTVAPQLTAPGLGDGEVLNLLAFGQVSPAGAGYANALYTAAGQLLLSRQVQRVGLDEFLLLPSGTALGMVGESAVRVGKFFAWPVPIWVRYEANTVRASHGQFEVEYHISKWMTLDASAYSEYQLYGLGVGLRHEF